MEPAAGGDGTPDRTVDDRTLLRLVRAGDDGAFGTLFARHAAAVRGYASRCCAGAVGAVDAEDMAAEAFFRVLQAVRRGSGPADNVRGYLFTVVRRLAIEWSVRRRDVPVAADELGRRLDATRQAPPPGVDLQLIAAAFTTLPRRWRAVLWRVEVEGERPAAAASHFGLSANATAALARRARQGLRAAYLQAHLAPAGGATGCRAVVAKLGGFTAGQVTGTEATRIREHLGGCASCQALHTELRDVCAGLRGHAGALAPLAGGALGGHHLLSAAALLGRVGHVLAVGVRAKLAVAALAVVAVGGVGFAAGPVVARLDPSPTVNRGVAVGPARLHTTTPSWSTGPRGGRIASAFDVTAPPRTHAPARRSSGQGARPTGLAVPAAGATVATTVRPPATTAGWTSVPAVGTRPNADGSSAAPVTTSASTDATAGTQLGTPTSGIPSTAPSMSPPPDRTTTRRRVRSGHW